MQTTDLGLRLYEGTDKFNPLIVENENTQDISDEILSLQEDVITVATELASGTVHALTRENPNTAVMRFTATANWTSGDTCTVDGVQVSTLLPSGATLGTGAYIIGSEVLCVLVGTRLTMYLTGVSKADDSDKLGGELPSYYGTAEDTAQALATAQAASTISQATQLEVNQINEYLVELLKWKNIGAISKNGSANISPYINTANEFMVMFSTSYYRVTIVIPNEFLSANDTYFYGGSGHNTSGTDSVRAVVKATNSAITYIDFVKNNIDISSGNAQVYYR